MPRENASPPRPPRQLPPWALALITVAATGLSLVVFALFDHVIPRAEQDAAYVSQATQAVYDSFLAQALPEPATTAAPGPAAQPGAGDPVDPAPDTPADAPAETTVPPAVDESLIAAQAAVGDFSAKFADKFTDGEVIATDTTYQSANVNITLSRITGKIGDYEQVCFVEDIYIRNIDCLRTVLAKDKFGRSLTEDALSMSRRANALCAINADFYSFGNAGIVIRNGVLYRDRYQTDEEVLVIFRNGSMEVFSKASQMDMEALMARGAWQAFSFGPSLLNEQGELRARYKSVNHDPRTIIGMVEPGHYLFIVVDGRQNGYSEGLTYYESALLAQRLGCTVAFNLDGGKTTQMLFDDRVVNKPYKGGRDTSDLICIADISR